ncbi:hypothetical protein FIBSPDRAFT_939689 [Athelia psychrophila]|uniref:Uncharacterized protein n=1 Tax=Athelia psychrophila TaxID=1759441 RepID=A0A167XDP3_9AGAM|nr:hypothetical protein FIBSPDRAFT_939689 [Fibularhizoctonia sp. CBS 109695]
MLATGYMSHFPPDSAQYHPPTRAHPGWKDSHSASEDLSTLSNPHSFPSPESNRLHDEWVTDASGSSVRYTSGVDVYHQHRPFGECSESCASGCHHNPCNFTRSKSSFKGRTTEKCSLGNITADSRNQSSHQYITNATMVFAADINLVDRQLNHPLAKNAEIIVAEQNMFLSKDPGGLSRLSPAMSRCPQVAIREKRLNLLITARSTVYY